MEVPHPAGPPIPERADRASTLRTVLAVGRPEDDAERIRRCEVSRTLGRMKLSSEGEEAVERLSHSLVEGLLRGPIPEVLASLDRGRDR